MFCACFWEKKNAAISSDTQISDAVVIECNIDDMNPECYDHLMDLLFAAGRHDVFSHL